MPSSCMNKTNNVYETAAEALKQRDNRTTKSLGWESDSLRKLVKKTWLYLKWLHTQSVQR